MQTETETQTHNLEWLNAWLWMEVEGWVSDNGVGGEGIVC